VAADLSAVPASFEEAFVVLAAERPHSSQSTGAAGV
jgi:hypothetical protein